MGNVLALLYGGTLLALVASARLAAPPWLALAAWIVVELALTLVAFLLLRRAGLGELARWTASPAACGVAAAVGLATCALSVAFVAAVVALAGGGHEPVAFDTVELVAVLVVAPLLEEWMCRGVLWQALGPFSTPWARTAASAVLFGLLHCLDGLLGFAHRFVAGLAFGTLRERTGSLLPPIVAHATHNLACVLYAVAAAS